MEYGKELLQMVFYTEKKFDILFDLLPIYS